MAGRAMLGDWELIALSDGCFRLDGGSMFGVVPKTLWEKKKPADERNRIRLGLNSLLVRTPQALVLVETGIGDKLNARERDIYGLERESDLLQALRAEGFTPRDVDYVIHSHLHLDHCGWATRELEGCLQPTFPNARYIVQGAEWEAAAHPDPRSRPSYDRRNFSLLEREGLLVVVGAESEVIPGIRVLRTGGHTRGHQVVYIENGGSRCLFLGDLVPTKAHMRTNWHMGWDLFPLQLMQAKESILAAASRSGEMLFFTHEDGDPFARLAGGEGELRPLDG